VKRTDSSNVRSYGIVVTGGGSGLGFSLAAGFLEAGDRVVICGRDGRRLEYAVQELQRRFPEGVLYSMVCDVSKSSDLERFSSFVLDKLGMVDRWINNAGSAGLRKRPLWELGSEDICEVCATNLAGTMMASAVAVNLMLRQPPSRRPVYHIFNMGFSWFGAGFSRTSVPHRTSKLAVATVTALLQKELRAKGTRAIGVHELSPGLVKTALLFRDAAPETVDFLQKVAEEPEIVARVLVRKIRAASDFSSRVRYASFSSVAFRAFAAALSGRAPG